jgi:hypothetical protein
MGRGPVGSYWDTFLGGIMSARIHFPLLVVAALSLVGCNGISAVRVVTNGPADVSVDGQFLGAAPVMFPLPWRNIDNNINYAQRNVKVTAGGLVVYDKEISNDIAMKAQTGDYKEGSEFGTGRTYTLMVDVHPAPAK